MNLSHDPTYPLFPIMSFLAFVVSLIPLPWHIQAFNSGTCAYMIWIALACLNSFINSLIWKDDLKNVSPVWCDISSKLIVGITIGIPASVLCISRRLHTLTSIQTASVTPADKRRMIIIDLCIAVGFPVLIMALHYIVQGHRFDILGDVGCYPVIYTSIPAYFLYYMWPLVLGLVSFVYSALNLRFFWLRRAQFMQMFSSGSSLPASKYLRLMLLSVMDMLFTVPLTIFLMYFGAKDSGIRPWISWEDTHFNFSRVVLVPSIVWRSDSQYSACVQLTRWLPIVCSFIFFALFGFAVESKKAYASVFWTVATRFGFKRRPSENPKGKLPSWVKPFKTKSSLSSSSDLSTKPTFDIPTATPTLNSFAAADLERGFRQSPSATSLSCPPPYARASPKHVPSDILRDSLSEFPSTPNSDSPFSDSANVVNSATSKGEYELKWKLSLESFSSTDRFYMDVIQQAHLPSPPPFANVAAPGFHRPFSPPLPYPATTPYPNASMGFVPEQGIRVTIHTETTTSPELPFRRDLQ